MLPLIILTLLHTASAQPRDAGRVQFGEDIQAWQALVAEDPDDPEALRAFVEDFPTSPLAEVAYARLNQLGGPKPELSPVVLARMDASLDAHRDALSRRPTQVAVATLPMGAATLAPGAGGRSGLAPRIELGAFGEPDCTAVYLGGGLHGELAGLGARGARGNGVWDAVGFVQLHPLGAPRLEPYLELSAGMVSKWNAETSRQGPVAAAALGAYAPLTHSMSLSGAAELRYSEAGASVNAAWGPRVRLGLTWTF